MLSFKFGADGSAYTKGLDKMRMETKQWSSSIKGMIGGALGGAALFAGVKKLVDQLDRVGKLSTRLGKSAEDLQRIGLVADLAGSDMERLAKSLTMVEVNAGMAASGSKTMSDAFERMGINIEEFRGADLVTQLGLLSDGFLLAEDSGTGFSDAQQIMGGSAKELIPLLRQGSEAITDQAAAASVASNSMVDSAQKMNDKITIWGNTLIGWVFKAVEAWEVLVVTFTAGVQGLVAVFTNGFTGIIDTVVKSSEVIAKASKFDFSGAKESLDDIGKIAKRTASRIKEDFDAIGQAGRQVLAGDPKKKTDPEAAKKKLADADATAKAAKTKEENLTKIAKLEKEIADARAKSEEDSLTAAEKRAKLTEDLTQAQKKFRAASDAAIDAEISGSKETVELQLAELEAQKEMLRLRGEVSDADKKDAADQKKAEDDLSDKTKDLNKKEKEIDEENAFAKMSDPEKLKSLKEKQKGLLGGSQEDRIEGKGMQQGIDDLETKIIDDEEAADKEAKDGAAKAAADEKSASEKAAKDAADKEKKLLEDQKVDEGSSNLIASSIQAIGGGGGVSMLGDPQLGEAKKTNDKLDKLIANTAPAGGNKEVET